jgi:DNA mismatch endonuclease (patch repair protein)
VIESEVPVFRVESGSVSSNPMDNLSKQERSQRMSRIKGVDTGPEMIVRRMVHGMGFRYRLHVRNLPGLLTWFSRD